MTERRNSRKPVRGRGKGKAFQSARMGSRNDQPTGSQDMNPTSSQTNLNLHLYRNPSLTSDNSLNLSAMLDPILQTLSPYTFAPTPSVDARMQSPENRLAQLHMPFSSEPAKGQQEHVQVKSEGHLPQQTAPALPKGMSLAPKKWRNRRRPWSASIEPQPAALSSPLPATPSSPLLAAPSSPLLAAMTSPQPLAASPLQPARSAESQPMARPPLIGSGTSRSNRGAAALAGTGDREVLRPEGKNGYIPNVQATKKISTIMQGMPFYKSWGDIPLDVRREWFRKWKSFFTWDEAHEDHMWRAFNSKGSYKLSDIYSRCKINQKPKAWMGEQFWEQLQDHWNKDSTMKRSETNRRNRNSQKGGHLHTAGAMSAGTVRMKMAEQLGRDPTPYELHCRLRKRKATGEWVEPRAQEVAERFEAAMREAATAGQESHNEENSAGTIEQTTQMDIWKRVAGGRRGRVYGLSYLADDGISQRFADVPESSNAATALRDEMRAEIARLDSSMREQVQREYDGIRRTLEQQTTQITRLEDTQRVVAETQQMMATRFNRLDTMVEGVMNTQASLTRILEEDRRWRQEQERRWGKKKKGRGRARSYSSSSNDSD